MDNIIDGVILTPLKVIQHPKGDIKHVLKQSDKGFNGFGEAYFSEVKFNEIKGWKKHRLMTLNFAVPIGELKVVLHDDRDNSPTKGVFNTFNVGNNNYQRVTIPPGIWTAFKGIDSDKNMLLNVANIIHDPAEAINKELNELQYDWADK